MEESFLEESFIQSKCKNEEEIKLNVGEIKLRVQSGDNNFFNIKVVENESIQTIVEIINEKGLDVTLDKLHY
jgi:hypothetical protein